MKRILLIIIFQLFVIWEVQCQTFSLNELINLPDKQSSDIESYMNNKGFTTLNSKLDSSEMAANFIENIKSSNGSFDKKSVDVIIKGNTKYFTLHTTILNEYLEGKQFLINTGFFYDTANYKSNPSVMLFAKDNITIGVTSNVQDGIKQYNFSLVQKTISSIMYTEDLLQFDSHEVLINFFGKENVKKDVYYLSEKQVRKCSVLYGGTPRQAIFIWGNDVYLNKLLYILVTHSPPAEGLKKSYPLSQDKEWKLKNGIFPGMSLDDLLKLNESDFEIYGNKSELSFLVKPNEKGKIDFKKIAVMLSCQGCYNNKIFNQQEVSAVDVENANISMNVFDVVIYSSSD